MPYHYTEFDGVPLPIYNPSQNHDSTEVESSLVRSAGGLFDHYGSRRRAGQGLRVQMTGLYVGALSGTFLVDHDGNYLVEYGDTPFDLVTGSGDNLTDHAGNQLITLAVASGRLLVTGDEADDLRGQIDALRAKVGVRGALIRHLLPDGDNRQFVTARLLRVGWPQDLSDRIWKAELSCEFESTMETWHSTTQTVTEVNLFNGPQALNVEQRGTATVEDATLTIAALATITRIRVQNSALGVDWIWTGTLLDGQTLIIAAGAQTVRQSGIDAYSGLTFNAGHTAQGWLPLWPGVNALTITSDQSGTATLSHHDQWL